MDNDFRPAVCVELYDAQVMVRRDEDGGFCDYDFPGLHVAGDTVRRFLEHLGIIPQTATGYDVVGRGQEQTLRNGEGFALRREAAWYGMASGMQVTALEARVRGAHLVDMRVVHRDPDGGTWTTEHTYSGAFAVEWETEEVATA